MTNRWKYLPHILFILLVIAVFIGLSYISLTSKETENQTLQNEQGRAQVQDEKPEIIKANLSIEFPDGQKITCVNEEIKQGGTVFELLKTCSERRGESFILEYETHPEFGA